MKKIAYSLFAVLICLLVVSCATAAVDPAIHATTFDEFVQAFTAVKEDETKTVILLENDIVWDATQYNEGLPFTPKATGLTIDFGGHTISDVPKNAFNLTGEAFTVKNGTVLGRSDNSRYSININYEGTNGLKELALPKIPASYDDSDPVWANRVIVEDLTATGMLCGYSTVEVKNCQFIGGQYRGLVFQGSSGVVENVTTCTLEDGASAGFVAHSYGVVTVKGDCSFKGKFGIYTAFCGKCIIDPAATVKAGGFVTYGIYAETQGTSEIYGTLDLQPGEGKQAYIIRSGANSIIEKGANLTINGAAVATGAIVAEAGNANVDYKDGNGEKDKDYAGFGVNGFITDLR